MKRIIALFTLLTVFAATRAQTETLNPVADPQAVVSWKAKVLDEEVDCRAESVALGTASDEDVQAEIERYAEENGMVAEDLTAKLTDSDKNYFRERANVDKAVRLIADSAVETEEAEKAEA